MDAVDLGLLPGMEGLEETAFRQRPGAFAVPSRAFVRIASRSRPF
jgi:hypothetical protein